MFIFFQKCQFVYQNNVISPPIRQFPSFSIKRYGTRKPQDLLLGKSSICFRSPSWKYRQLCICSDDIFDPGLNSLEVALFSNFTVFSRRHYFYLVPMAGELHTVVCSLSVQPHRLPLKQRKLKFSNDKSDDSENVFFQK